MKKYIELDEADESPVNCALIATTEASNALAIIDLRTLRSEPEKREAIKQAREHLAETRTWLELAVTELVASE